MRELMDDPFYGILEEYDDLVVEYVLLSNEQSYAGYMSHKFAVLFAMLKIIERDIDCELRCDGFRLDMIPWSLDMGKAKAQPIDAASLLHMPEIKRIDCYGNRFYDSDWPTDNDGGQIPYWYAFLEPPHGTGPVKENGKTIRKAYGQEDFEIVNRALFPQGTDELEAYEWTTDWSNYFDDGHEWWGAACWSVYDKKMDRYAVIMASATD